MGLSKKYITNISRIATAILFIYALGNFLADWAVYAFSNFWLDLFDGALRILPHYYISEGLIPYKDFGVVYPPGLFLLIGKIIPFVSIFQRNLIVALLYLGLLVVSWILLYTIPPKNKRTLFPIAFTIMLETILLNEDLLFGEPLSRTLICILILMLVHIMRGRKFPLFFVALISALTVWFRWSNIALLVLVQTITVAGLILYSYFKNSHIRDDLKKIWKFVVFEAIGVFLGLGSLLLYLVAIGAFSQGVDFIFNIPSSVILEYRKLSLFRADAYSIILFSTAFIVLCVNVFYVLRQRAKSLLLFLSIIPFSVLPYALGRVDPTHMLQFYYFVGLSVVIVCTATHKMKFLFLLMAIFFIPTYSYLLPFKLIYPQSSGPLLYVDLEQNLADCKEEISNVKDYRSLFVGRLSYDSFIMSIVSLYLINPHVRPAAAFISDEPGLQNSVKYGSIIADQLKKAPKPMLAFLEIGNQTPEPNKTQFMKSKGKIEQMLANNRHGTVGACQAYGRNFVIRLYE